MLSRRALLGFAASQLARGEAWQLGDPVLLPGIAGSFDETAVKDPSIVRHRGRWHLFYTARGRTKYGIGYVSAASLSGLQPSPRIHLSQLRGEQDDYAAAPQVFYFRPKKQWFLIYQTRDANYLPVYSTTASIDAPDSWSKPRPLVAKQDKAKWIDFWVICDDKLAYLFLTRDHNEVVVMTTSLDQFPAGFTEPRAVFAPVHEAVHVYRAGRRFIMLYEIQEAGDVRRHGLAWAPSLAGPWQVESATWATGDQLIYAPGAERWTSEVSHGELIRRGFDERLEIDPRRVEFLIQGLPAGRHTGDYVSLPWRLGLIRTSARI